MDYFPSISVDAEGVWTYTSAEGVSVRYPNGYPDFKGARQVTQEVDIGEFVSYRIDFSKAKSLGVFVDFNEYTLHHSEDGHTLQVVNKLLHKKFTHRGGMANMRKKGE